ncbi:Hypothetical protein PHPALM_36926, partial [Phytophthora palmivora]
MADMNRRKGGVRSQQSYMQQAAASPPQQQFSPYQQQMQQTQPSPYQYQQYQKQQQTKAPAFHPSRKRHCVGAMADMNRRKGGVRSQQSYMQQAAASPPQQQFSPYQQQMQQTQPSPYQYQQYQKQQQTKAPAFHPSRSGGYRSTNSTARPGAQKPSLSGAKMGIKSGMTVEDLKRLTQKRMQQSAGNPATPKTAAPEGFSTSRPATPKINMAVVNATSTPAAIATPPVIPKTGMSVQELKQLTALRVASQNVPVHASEVTGLVSKAVLNNAAKSHYR